MLPDPTKVADVVRGAIATGDGTLADAVMDLELYFDRDTLAAVLKELDSAFPEETAAWHWDGIARDGKLKLSLGTVMDLMQVRGYEVECDQCNAKGIMLKPPNSIDPSRFTQPFVEIDITVGRKKTECVIVCRSCAMENPLIAPMLDASKE